MDWGAPNALTRYPILSTLTFSRISARRRMMPSGDLTTSIVRQRGFSGGALPIVSTKPWALVLSELRSRTSSDWTKDAVEIREIVGTEPFEGTANELYQPAATLARFICHFLIERMPDRA